ncbi:SIS domain-containing protein [Microbacterium sp.]|uniref:SIS domain-containing protein n=1 Tax=Microbacterium sp. TaxID=51671 RepID=UPI000925955D|nr:SIS domain-containing protein [Microbacterium sp.]OJU61356.1 MAG: sugar isomerase [Microbacterium sp. 70-38]
MTDTATDESARGGHMEAELASQPDCWQRVSELDGLAAALRRPGERVAVVGCGTSWFVAQTIAALREGAGLGPTDAYSASEATLTERGYDAVVVISRSGTTTEIVTLLSTVPSGVRSVAIVADDRSPVARLADEVVALPFADERSVVQTRFATTAIALGRVAAGEDLTNAIADARRVLSLPLPAILTDAEQLTCLGSGWTVGIAHEAALKMREASQSWTESYPGMEYRHGPMSIAAPGRTVWVFGDGPRGLAEEVAGTGASYFAGDADPLAELVRAHRVSLARARSGGLDADAPRNLTRSVILSS